MHGLVNRAIQCFVRDTYGGTMWERLARQSDAPVAGFEAMFVYDDEVTERMLCAAEDLLGRDRAIVLEDLGTYLVSHPNVGSLRRLLRFGGDTFPEFLDSLDDLPSRAALAVPELELPRFDVMQGEGGIVRVLCRSPRAGFGHVLVGIMRTLADDYGALVLLEHEGREGENEWISVSVLSADFAQGRPFQLAADR
ncbi:heme NO-binding protein [Meridianimarinicoccus roseus]|uniref:Heme NO-binding protein n=1 Tax=Meridianimarinicoccus roseus TaxID=2072018 RepID=A0A2V2LGP5_9RHOB|nr:heme NO-binding domain-containing protein [Meridianimarinicoccus roseus]PWR04142.1 heme NO-binding protein [Meridianimarinicoccus roseus]